MCFYNYTQDKNAITLQEMLTGKEKEKGKVHKLESQLNFAEEQLQEKVFS